MNHGNLDQWNNVLYQNDELAGPIPVFQAVNSDRRSLDAHTSLQLKAQALDDPWLVKCMGQEARDIMCVFLVHFLLIGLTL